MSYVDAMWDRDKDVIHVVERDEKGQRRFVDYPSKYVFYYPENKGKYHSIFGENLSKVTTRSWKEFTKEQKIHSNHTLYESDINPVFRVLEEHYLGQEPPKLHVAFFDIEVDFDPERGYASPDDAFMPITAIAVHLQWMETLVCLAIPPKTMTMEQATEAVKEFPNTILFETEAELLDTFLTLIEDADVITGWNSEGFDVPYTVNRVIKVLSKEDTKRFCLWDQYPKKREYEKYGRTAITYDFVGRVHLDSLEVYRKYKYEEQHSYRLDVIGELEIGEKKTQYEGTLDQLYNQDFKRFIEYNRQDTSLLDKMDKKLKFLDLANVLAHGNTVLLQTTMGAVAMTEQAIINEAHSHGLIVPSRQRKGEQGDTAAAGAYVAFPKKGLHDWIGAIDINSLYPSAIRALNMGPETIVGQLRQTKTLEYLESQMTLHKKSFAGSWEDKFGTIEYEAVINQDKAEEITIDWENGDVSVHSGAEIYEIIFNSNKPWILSANGTIFTYEKEGIIPGLLKRWYSERKEMQRKSREAETAGNNIEAEYWDKRQMVRKINLNSLYGALLNPGCRFFDKRIGQSTTLVGRQVARHMAAKINEIVCGTYDYKGKSIIYGDTDSCYFSAWSTLRTEVEKGNIVWDKDNVVQLYDQIADDVNDSFPQFMLDYFHVPKSRGEVIKGGRELVAIKGLFITKKRYAVLIYDKEGKRIDVNGKPGKIKAMGLDLKRSDTPEYMQNFLEEVLLDVLQGAKESDVLDKIVEFRQDWKSKPGWEKGSPRRANKITDYQEQERKAGKANMPGHVRASINYNRLREMNGDKYSQQIVDGMKVYVCKVKNNAMGFTSVAYPVDELKIPKWFQELPFDELAMEETIIDNKLSNLIGVLEWDLQSTTDSGNTFNKLFDFE
jgi:DNA polymerase elongation subunit (family B)